MLKTATTTIGYAAVDAEAKLAPYSFERREPRPNDVAFDVTYCGVCHSDIHQARDEWQNTVWPCMPGHEVVGTVTAVGADVTRFQIGDSVAVGCLVDSCGACEACRAGEEQYCEGPHGALATYNGPMKNPDGSNTFGGYATTMIAPEHFILALPKKLDPKSAAPLLCSAVTVYSPMKHFGIKAGTKVGVVGIGGLGHIAIKIASALGANVTAFTRSADKAEDAKRFGAGEVVVSTDKGAMKQRAASFDFILSTIPTKHDVNPYIALLKRDGRITLVGALEKLEPINNGPLAFGRISFGGSLIGSIAETQEILDFCAEHGIASEVEVIGIDRINEAFESVNAANVRYRYVIDASTIAKAATKG